MGLARAARSSGLVLATVAGLAAGAILTGSLAPVSADLGSGDRPVFVPMTPCRIFDTRPGSDNVGPRSTPLGAADGYTVNGRGTTGNCTIPNDALALTLNVTAVGATLQTNLRVYPTGAPLPLTSNLNPAPGAPPTPNAVTTDLSAAGQFTVYNFRGTVHVLADVAGYYVHHHHDDRYPTDAEVDAKIAAAAPPFVRNLVDNVGAVGRNPAVAIGADGNPVISYDREDVLQLRVAACDDPACTTARINVVDATVDISTTSSSIAIKPDGNPIISYYDGGANRLKVASCNDPACDSAAIVFVDGPGTGFYSSIAIAPNGLPVIAYWDGLAIKLKLALCADTVCLSSTKKTVTDGGNRPSMVLGPNGNPFIVHNVAGNTHFVSCADPACTGTTLGTFPSSGSEQHVVLAPSGNPVVAFGNGPNPNVALCADPACAQSSVVSTGVVGNDFAISFGPSGTPVVAIHTHGNRDDLLTATCVDSACSGFTIERLDTAGNVGAGVAMTTGADGRPVMAYQDTTNGELKVAKL